MSDSKVKGLWIATRCRSIGEFVAHFHPFCDGGSIFVATLSGRAVGRWRGRRAAYFAIAGFCVLLATLGAGALFHGRHGS